MRALERRVAHLLGWHTVACLKGGDLRPRRLWVASGCECPPGAVARVWPLLGWHRWIGGVR